MKKIKIASERGVKLGLVLTVPFVILFIVISAVTGYIAYSSGINMIEKLSTDMLNEINTNIESHIENFIGNSRRTVEFNAEHLGSGFVNLSDQRSMEIFFLNQIKYNSSISSLYFGNPSGGLADAGRDGASDGYYIMETRNFTGGELEKISVDSRGLRLGSIFRIDYFDARQRPWYKQAAEEGKVIISRPYILSTGQDMAISVSMPVYGENAELRGVVSADVFLSQLSGYLSDLEISPNGYSFILDDEGMLLATSLADSKVIVRTDDGELRQLAGKDSPDIPIREMTEKYNELNDGFESSDWAEITVHGSDREKFNMLVSAIDFDCGLVFNIITIIPRSDLFGAVYRKLFSSMWIVIGALVVLLFIGIIITRVITGSIRQLGEVADNLAEGKWHRAPENHGIKEINNIYSIFNNLSKKTEEMVLSLNGEIQQRKKYEEDLRENKQQLELAVEATELGIWDSDQITGENRYNSYWSEMIGYADGEIGSSIDSWQNLLHPEDRLRVMKEIDLHLSGKTDIYSSEYRLMHKTGRYVWIQSIGKIIQRDEDGRPVRICGTHRDISGRKESEEKILTLLNEKEVLLNEVHHRIKNNMQTIKGLLMLQSYSLSDPSAKNAIEEAGSRIDSMLLLYNQLYISEDVNEVVFNDYLSLLVDQIIATHHRTVELEKKITECRLPVKTASTLGIVINELITNTMKYAYSVEETLRIGISLEQDSGYMVLIIEDNGVKTVETKTEPGTGLNLVEKLVEQIDGEFSMFRDNGTVCRIKFRS